MELKHKKALALFISSGTILFSFMFWRTSENGDLTQVQGDLELGTSLWTSSDTQKKKSMSDSLKFKPLESVKIYGDLMQKMASGEVDIQEVINELSDLGLTPSKVMDRNDFTGDMTIVRVGVNLPGTRYFHGQFFSNDNGAHELQHLSIDYAGGEESLAEVAKVLSQSLGILGTPEVSRDGYESYRVNNKYIFWAKVLTEEDFKDLKTHPYKAYEKKDIGRVIRIALEEEIH